MHIDAYQAQSGGGLLRATVTLRQDSLVQWLSIHNKHATPLAWTRDDAVMLEGLVAPVVLPANPVTRNVMKESRDVEIACDETSNVINQMSSGPPF